MSLIVLAHESASPLVVCQVHKVMHFESS